MTTEMAIREHAAADVDQAETGREGQRRRKYVRTKGKGKAKRRKEEREVRKPGKELWSNTKITDVNAGNLPRNP